MERVDRIPGTELSRLSIFVVLESGEELDFAGHAEWSIGERHLVAVASFSLYAVNHAVWCASDSASIYLLCNLA